MNGRKIEFEGIRNARDLGRLRTVDGHAIAPGLLLRSANLVGAAAADVVSLQETWHLARVVDLRTATERDEGPDAAVEGAAYLPIPIFDERVAGISHEKRSRENQGGMPFPNMENLYRIMAVEDSCRKNFGRAARAVMEHDFTRGSVLWHCTEGKDRCGLLTAILLCALRIDRGQIMEDYLLTNEVNGPKAELYYQQMLTAGKPAKEAAAVRDAFLAKASYLEEAFAAIDQRYPEPDTYLCEGLGLSQTLIAGFRESVLL